MENSYIFKYIKNCTKNRLGEFSEEILGVENFINGPVGTYEVHEKIIFQIVFLVFGVRAN